MAKVRIPGESVRSPKQTHTAGEERPVEPGDPTKRADYYEDYGPESTLPAGAPCNAKGQMCAEGETPTHRIDSILTKRGWLIGRPVPIK